MELYNFMVILHRFSYELLMFMEVQDMLAEVEGTKFPEPSLELIKPWSTK